MSTPKLRGQVLTANEMNRLARVANRTVDSTAAGLDLLGSDTGVSISPSPTEFRLEDCRQVKHTTRAICPLYGVLEEWQSAEAVDGPVLTKVRRPYRSGFGRLLIAREGLDENEIGFAQFQNVTPVLYANTGVPGDLDVQAGDRLGGREGSYIAQPDELGPFRILTIVSDSIAIVEITGRRGDYKNCRMIGEGRFDGAYQTIIWAAGFDVSEVSQGITKVELG